MIKKQEMKSLIVVALPLMAAFLAQRSMQFIDTVMMGWLGPEALAAGALGTALFWSVLIFCMGVLSAIGVFIARAKGEEKFDDIKSIVHHGFYLALLLSIPCMLIIWWMPSALLLIGENPLVVLDTKLLLHGLAWGFPGFLFFLVLREFISAFSLTFIVMIVSLISIPLTFAVNYVLIYGTYHFPQLGIAGIGYGGSVVMWFMFFSLFFYSKKHPRLKTHFDLQSSKFDRNKFSDILHVGIPSGGLFLLESGMFLSTALIMGYFGVAALAAHQIALQCVNIAYTFPVALAMATALEVGHAAGAKNLVLAQRIAIFSFSLVLLVSFALAIIFCFSTNALANVFLFSSAGNVKEVHQLATAFLYIAALFLCFDALQSVVNGALRGLRDTFIPMLLSIGCYWFLGVSGAYYLSMHTHLGARGVWYGLTLGLSSAAILLLWRFSRKLKFEKMRDFSKEQTIL